MSRLLLSAAFVLALGITSTRADDAPKAEPVKAEPAKDIDAQELMKAMQKAATPGEEHRKLDAFIGSWSFVAKMTIDPSKPPMETKGECERKWTLGKRFVQESAKGTCEATGHEYEGMGVLGYDNTQKKYVSGWVDNMSTSLDRCYGTFDNTGKILTFTSEKMCPLTNEQVKTRTVVTIAAEDKVNFEMFVNMGGKEIRAFEINYTRKK